MLAYFRSQHHNQSWLSSLTTVLDASALVMIGVDGACRRHAELTFAMARHAVVDLAQVFNTPPSAPAVDRLPPAMLSDLRDRLARAGLRLRDGAAADRELGGLRALYEPYVIALARYLTLTLPEWLPADPRPDNWQTTAWEASLVPGPSTGSREEAGHLDRTGGR